MLWSLGLVFGKMLISYLAKYADDDEPEEEEKKLDPAFETNLPEETVRFEGSAAVRRGPRARRSEDLEIGNPAF